jgi:protein-disulfide isomerase
MDEALPLEGEPTEEGETEIEGQPARSLSTRLFALLIPLAFVLGLGAGYLVWGRGGETAVQAGETPPEAQAAAADATPRKVTRYDVPVDDDPALGPANAAITIIEFSDFQCPFCTRWHDEVWSRLKAEYPSQVRLVYRDFPLTSIHPDAIPAAEAANCANEQGAYWDYHNKLFAAELGLGREALDQYASELNLDAASFKKCVDERRYQAEVENDLNYAMNLGVRSTPTFFINGIALVGAQPYEIFKDVIDKELAGEIPK